MVSIKLATLDNLNDLIRLRVEFLREAEKINNEKLAVKLTENLAQYFEENMPNGDFISWFAIKDDKIVGTSGICFRDTPPNFKNLTGKEAFIMNMYTLPNWRNQGIGTKLLNKVVEEAKKRGIQKIILDTTEAGKKIYLKRGFQFLDNIMELKIE